MKVLVIGQGGREHAIAWKLKQSKSVVEVFCAPGNPGTMSFATNVDLKVDQIEELVSFAKENKIDLTVIGPEYPLSLGITDSFRKNDLLVFGPSKAASELESSKAFAKEIMKKASVPTAEYAECVGKENCLKALKDYSVPVVLKADGLAAGKGVFVCMTQAEVDEAVASLFSANPEQKVVVEDYLNGVEASFICACSENSIVPMASSHDFKRIYEKDLGPNTGGMGAVSPTVNLTKDQEEFAIEHVVKPVLKQMKEEGKPFSGFIYAGLMITEGGTIDVLEFNVRLGDPETQSILMRLDSDFFEILYKLAKNEDVPTPVWSEDAAVCVVMASENYPDTPKTGDVISGLEHISNINNAMVFHAGTKLEGKNIVTAGGRVLNVVGRGADVEEARNKAYQAVDMIQFRGAQLRRDIS
ncbi:UNVERIFIED_CONTAM: hypothetical protein GTU68_007453 [Idotea baltica]|nr:hypothetical protein [Idotea baltica]